jgi:hypothetical protein
MMGNKFSSSQFSTNIMSPVEIQALFNRAQQGDPQAIASLLHHATKRKGVTVRARRQDRKLHLLLEGDRVPNQQPAVNYVRHQIERLQVQSIESVTVYGKHHDLTSPEWSDSFPINHQNAAQAIFSLDQSANLNEVELPVFPSEAFSEAFDSEAFDVEAPDKWGAAGQDAVGDEVDQDEQEQPEGAIADELPILHPVPYIPPEQLAVSSHTMETTAQTPQIPDFLKRPDAVALILCALILTLWDTYLAILNDVDSLDSLSASQLARRLGVETRQVRTNKRHAYFGEWTQSLDPNGIGWKYQQGMYVPIKA